MRLHWGQRGRVSAARRRIRCQPRTKHHTASLWCTHLLDVLHRLRLATRPRGVLARVEAIIGTVVLQQAAAQQGGTLEGCICNTCPLWDAKGKSKYGLRAEQRQSRGSSRPGQPHAALKGSLKAQQQQA